MSAAIEDVVQPATARRIRDFVTELVPEALLERARLAARVEKGSPASAPPGIAPLPRDARSLEPQAKTIGAATLTMSWTAAGARQRPKTERGSRYGASPSSRPRARRPALCCCVT